MKHTLKINGMHCTSCALGIERSVKNLGKGFSAKVNFASNTALIEADDMEGITKIIELIKESGYDAVIADEHFGGHHHEGSNVKEMKKELIITFLFSIPLFLSMIQMVTAQLSIFSNPYIQLISATAIIIANKGFYIRGYNAVFKAKSASMDTLVALGTGAAYIYSVINTLSGSFQELYFETAGLLLLFISLGEYFEAVSNKKAGDAIEELLKLSPKNATVLRGKKEMLVKIEELKKGDIIIIKPGERIPVDGVVIKGSSSVDESMISGESIPVFKKSGSEVIGGTINKNGAFHFKATKVGSETMLSQIVKMVSEAQSSKAPIQKLADRISSYFVPAVIVIALVSSIAWIIFGMTIFFSLKIFITVLVIACPCALGLATPTAIMVGTGKGAKSGILIKDASALENVQKAKTIVFDKTGTLTKNMIKVEAIKGYNNASANEVLSIAYSLEKNSEHPISKAIIERAKKGNAKLMKVEGFENIEGQGLVGKINGEESVLGSLSFMKSKGINSKIAQNDIKEMQSKGSTIVMVAKGKKLKGLISVNDELKDDAKIAVNELKKEGYNIYMITGDSEESAKAVSKELGITNVLSQVMPKEKADKIRQLQKRGKVIMVGDGVNDAVALSQADVGIALGSGTDVAIESGQIVLVKSSVKDVVKALKLSKLTFGKIKQNLFWAFFYNVLGIPVAAGILFPFTGLLLNPVIAAIAMSLSSVSVVANSLLIRYYKF